MTICVVYKTSRNVKNRSAIPRMLRASGCIQLHRALWTVEEKNISEVLRILREHQPILLRRQREIAKPVWDEKNGICDFGSLYLVAFNVPKERRKILSRALKKVACIPLCRGVYAFPQKRRFSEDKNGAIFHLLKLINENRGNARVIPRMRIEDRDSVKKLVEVITGHVKEEISDITASCVAFVQKINDKEKDKIRREQTDLEKRFADAKIVASGYKEWLGINFSKEISKANKAFLELRRIKNEKVSQVSITFI